MDETDVFVQIYIFYPTFGQNPINFRPNLYLLPHIWTKSVFFIIPDEKATETISDDSLGRLLM